MPISSAVQLADLALVWSNVNGQADLMMIDSDLASERGLVSAALLSLFTDRRAKPDDVPPSGDDRDRRGWLGDEFAAVAGDLFGSRLWLLDRSKRVNETTLLARQYITEALAWMIEDSVVESIDIVVETAASSLNFSVGLNRPGVDPVSFRFSHVWDHIQQDK